MVGFQSSNSGNQHPSPAGRPCTRLDDDLHVAAEQHEESDETIEREPRKPAANQSRHFRLIDLKQLRCGSLRQSALRERGDTIPMKQLLSELRRPE
jgi:hypothetical protein